MEKQYGRRYNIEGRHGYTDGIPEHIAITHSEGRGGVGVSVGGNGAAGIHDQNCMKFIAAAVSISVAYLCGLIWFVISTIMHIQKQYIYISNISVEINKLFDVFDQKNYHSNGMFLFDWIYICKICGKL